MEKLVSQEEQIARILKDEIDELVIHGEKFTEIEKSRLNEKRKQSDAGEIETPENREQVKLKLDLDGRAALSLFELAGIKYKKLTFVPKGSSISGSINIDTGNRAGLVIEKDGTVFFDHHNKEKPKKGSETSATQIVYETLVANGLLNKEEWLDNFVKFVTEIDNANYPIDEKFLKNGWAKSLYGLYKIISFDTIVKCFKMGKTAESPFTDEEIANVTVGTVSGKERPLKDVLSQQQKFVENNIEEVRKAEDFMHQHRINNFDPKYLKKVLVNFPPSEKINKISLGFTATRALGFDSYIIYGQNGSFFISSVHPLDEVYGNLKRDFPDAKMFRGTMIVQSPNKEKVPADKFFRALNLIR